MKKENTSAKTSATDHETRKGYNEKNPAQSQGAFPTANSSEPAKPDRKSNTADKKKKEQGK